MSKLSNEQKKFIERAVITTQADLASLDLDPDKDDDLLIIINAFRSRGYIAPRSIDGGKEFDMWREIRNALGQPTKSPEQIVKEQDKQRAIGILRRTGEHYDKRIRDLEEQVQLAKKEKEDAYRDVEVKLDKQIQKLNKERDELLYRSKIAKKARKQLNINKKLLKLEDKQQKISDKRGKQQKCWHCGEWFTAGIGFINHEKSCKEKNADNVATEV